ncbi:hypothetical protein HG537_0G00940 [Torulaspora globosa]|uniref:Uncharacterized protein n=1 Tax=Torulaspora globosa TaxID=48254 RepID=A0A7H9HWU0_9SACH|nr:hypothetical protein HG537_0G00940 [Torulaspora sp. CBS 2947]
MQFSKLIVSAVAFVGLTSAQNASNQTTSNAAPAVGGSNNALNAGIVGAAAAGALAFLF